MDEKICTVSSPRFKTFNFQRSCASTHTFSLCILHRIRKILPQTTCISVLILLCY